MCYYEMVAKYSLPEILSMHPSAFVCNTHDSDQPGEDLVAMYVDEIGDYLDPFTHFLNEHCSNYCPTIIFSRVIYYSGRQTRIFGISLHESTNNGFLQIMHPMTFLINIPSDAKMASLGIFRKWPVSIATIVKIEK